MMMPMKKRKMCADGGFVEEEKASGFVDHEGDAKKLVQAAMSEDDRSLNEHGAKEEGPEGAWMAQGGMVGEESDAHMEDMVGRILKQSQKMYSKGGMVANDEHSFEEEFHQPNDFDDLALRDELEFSETGANSGDHLGNEGEDKRRKDIVSKVMASWRKSSGRNPSPA